MKDFLICIDLGLASAGWGLYELSESGDRRALDAGMRIFRDGRNADDSRPQNVRRRTARSMRRQTRRKRVRRNAVANAIRKHLNPVYRPGAHLPNVCRRKLLSEFASLNHEETLDASCALFVYLSKCRGPVYGWSEKKEPDRLAKTKRKPLWLRDEAEAAFDGIWRRAGESMPDKFTDEAKADIRQAIFFQRPIDDGDRGPCRLLAGEIRGWRHEPAIQRLSIRNDLSNLSIVFRSGTVRGLVEYPDLLDDLAKSAWDKRVSFSAINKACREYFGDIFGRLGGEAGQRDVGRDGVGPADLDTVDDVGQSTKTTAQFSVRAAEILIATMMRDGVRQATAEKTLRDAGVFKPKPSLASIPPGPAMLTFADVEEFLGGGVRTDQSLKICYEQTKSVVDDLIGRLPEGSSVKLAIETAKQVGRGKGARADYMKFMRDNRASNAAAGTKSIVDRVRRAWGSQCLICGSAVSSFCHAIPKRACFDKGETVENGLPLCPSCNQEMGDRTPHEFGRKNETARLAFDRYVKKLEAERESKSTEAYRKRRIKNHIWRFEPTARTTALEAGCPIDRMRPFEEFVKVGVAPIDKSPLWVRGKFTAAIRRDFGIAKDRRDYRHHAADALMLGFAHLKDRDERRAAITPEVIENVKSCIDRARISHRVDRFPEGRLHDETFLTHRFDNEGRAWNRKTGKFVSAIPVGTGRHVRYVRPNGNYCYEVFILPSGKAVGAASSIFEANQPTYREGLTKRPHPCATVAIRLRTEDTIRIGGELLRVSQVTKAGVVCQPANWGGKARDGAAKTLSASALVNRRARLVHRSPAGFESSNRAHIVPDTR